jgi:hypothetical protein
VILAIISLALIACNTMSSTHNLSAPAVAGTYHACLPFFPFDLSANKYSLDLPANKYSLAECCEADFDENVKLTGARCISLLCWDNWDNCAEIGKLKLKYGLSEFHLKDNRLLGEENPKESIAKNTTADLKSPNTDILKDNNVLDGNNNTSNDNVKEPKAPKVPDDFGGLNGNDSG